MDSESWELENVTDEFGWINCPVPLCPWRILTHTPSLAESLIRRHKMYGHVETIESDLL